MARNADDVVAIRASARMRELRVERRPGSQITTTARGRVITRRIGIPPAGADQGVTYRDVEVAVEIVAGAAEADADGVERANPTDAVERPAR